MFQHLWNGEKVKLSKKKDLFQHLWNGRKSQIIHKKKIRFSTCETGKKVNLSTKKKISFQHLKRRKSQIIEKLLNVEQHTRDIEEQYKQAMPNATNTTAYKTLHRLTYETLQLINLWTKEIYLRSTQNANS